MLRKYIGGMLVVAAMALAACGGGSNPTPVYPSPGVGNLTSGGASFTTNTTNSVNSTVSVAGSGQVSVSAGTTSPTGTNVPQLAHPTIVGQPPTSKSAPNTVIEYITITATANNTSVSQIGPIAVGFASPPPPANLQLAVWNGTNWLGIVSNPTINGNTASFAAFKEKTPIVLSSGQSIYLAIYTGLPVGTPSPSPTPTPPLPVASPASQQLSIGQVGAITLTAAANATITATSSNTAAVTVAASATTSPSGSASFAITGVALGTATITFTDPYNQKTTATVTVVNTAPTPQPSPASATIAVGDPNPLTVNITAKPNTLITATSSQTSVATVTASATTSSTGAATFTVTAVAGGTTTISFTDPYSDTGTMSVTVSAVKNGTFANSTTGWTPCSYAHTALTSGPVNPSTPTPATPVPTQSPGAATAVVTSGIPPLTVVAPPGNSNPNVTGASNAAAPTPTPPTVLGSTVGLIGSINAASQNFPKGEFGICQQVAVPAAAPYLSFWVFEGGSGYSFKSADQDAVVLDSTGTTVQQTLYAEQNCYLLPSVATPPGIWGGTGTATSSGCWPSLFGGDTSNYQDWIGGGFWSPRGPYNLSAYAGQTVTLYFGMWSFYADSAAYYAQFTYLGNVQMLPTSTFPTSAPSLRRPAVSVQLAPHH